jgi:hypothetical protein
MNHSAKHRAQVELAHAAGLVLADAILDANGNLLLPADTALTVTALAALQRRGIEQCVVWADDGDDGGDDGGDDAARAEREHALQRLAHLFRHTAAQDASAELMRLLSAYRNGARP